MRCSLALLHAACCTVSFSQGTAPDTLPPTNACIVAFVQERIGKKVDRGECWDLAAAALNDAHATWDGAYGFGDLIDWRKDTILPGDVVQFEGVTITTRKGDAAERISMGHHTAVVMVVHGRGMFTIAHQNFGKVGRKVSLLEFNMEDVRAGKVTFHRSRAGS